MAGRTGMYLEGERPRRPDLSCRPAAVLLLLGGHEGTNASHSLGRPAVAQKFSAMRNGSSIILYTNDTPVGAGALNKWRADVQLVQFFLHHFYLVHPEVFARLPGYARKGA